MTADRRTARLAADLAAADVLRTDPGASRADLVEAAVDAALRVMADEIRALHRPMMCPCGCRFKYDTCSCGDEYPCRTVGILDEFHRGGAS